MNIKATILLLFAVLGVLLTVLALSEVSSDWETVAQQVTGPIILIVFVAVILAYAFGRD